MGEEFQPVYFKVMGRGVPKTPLSQLPKFNLDVIPPPPWIPVKYQPPLGRGRGGGGCAEKINNQANSSQSLKADKSIVPERFQK